ncbi:MAG: hypothetical protein CMM37_12825 [Rhodospirillaceae bacterium]|nr:hypothetical protein [Rhodospirillaceae bacterium]
MITIHKSFEKNWHGIFFLLGPLAYFSVYALWLPILLILILKIRTFTDISWPEFLARLRHCSLYFVLPIFGGLSAFWALVPADAVSTAVKFFIYVLMALFLGMVIKNAKDYERQKIFLNSAIGFLLAFPFTIFDIALGGAIFSPFKSSLYAPDIYNRGTAITACLLIPITLGLYRYNFKKFSIVFALLSLGMIFGLYMEASKLAVTAALITFCFVRWKSKLFWVFITLPLLITLIFPLIFVSPFSKNVQCQIYEAKQSAMHRIMIYHFASNNILKKPLLGWGMDAARSIPGGGQKLDTFKCLKSGGMGFDLFLDGSNLPLHTHNAGIQIWLELGLIGAIILIISVFSFIKKMRIELDNADSQAALASTFVCCCLIYNISFGIWQSWLMFAMILVGSVLLMLSSRRDEKVNHQN